MPNDISARLKALSPEKRAALERALLAKGEAAAAKERIPRCDPHEANLLSFAEQRLWLLDQLEPSHPFYNMPIAARLTGPLDRSAFDAALAQLAQRHETLRYRYTLEDGEPQRHVESSVDIAPEWIDLRDTPAAGDPEALNELLRNEARKPFNLGAAPLLRCHVYRLIEDEHVVLLVMHHIVSDGWSMGVMLGELSQAYEAACAGCNVSNAGPLLPLPIDYHDYAVWQRKRLGGELAAKQIDFWREQLADAPSVLELPTDHPRGATQDFDGALLPLAFSPRLSSKLNAAADRAGATPFMVFMAAYQAWLCRMTGQTDMVIGSPVAGRQRTELERLIGFFVNTIAVRGDVAGDPTFSQLLGRVQQTTLAAFEHQDVPFDKVIEAVLPERSSSHAALFQAAMVVQNPPRDTNANPSVQVELIPVDNGTAKYDLTFFFWEDADADGEKWWRGHIEYRTSLFERETVERFAATFDVLLAGALDNPGAAVSDLPLLDEPQRRQLATWNESSRVYPPPFTLPELLARIAERYADKPAMLHGGDRVTYAQLWRRAQTVATMLAKSGVEPGDPVVACLPRSIDATATMLGVWLAGGVYVPVDAEQATQRLPFVVEDCGARVVVDAAWIDKIQRNAPEARPNAESGSESPPASLPNDRAYIIYTSGSTGRPKGVEVEHRGIVNFVHAQIETMGLAADDRILHAFSPAFDGGLSEQLIALATGATLVVADRETTLDPRAFSELLSREQVTFAKFPPALLATLDPDDLPELKTLSSAGDKLTGELAKRWVRGRRFFNGYGPTEATVGVAMYELPDPPDDRPPLGPPMPNMRAYVLDPHGNQQPIGVPGEIVIGGAGVARGYVNRPEETAEKFVPDPFVDMPGARMYRTGDLGRWRADGVLEFLGRVDDQVQLRGYRIEPGEVTAMLEALPEVAQAYTCVDTNESVGDRLVAYIVPSDGVDETALEDEHVESWRSLMEQTHEAAGHEAEDTTRDEAFDTSGWLSTFTGKPIPKEEMRAWAESTAERILALHPKRVLEIGCGGGIILQRVAPACERYVGCDLMAPALKQLQRVLDRTDQPWTENVELHRLRAHEAAALAPEKFDTIVMNSVVQYFPSFDYLLDVVEQAVKLLTPGGKLFLGDLRNLHLQETMAAAVERRKANGHVVRRELLGRIEARIRNEEELLVAPELLLALQQRLPRSPSISIDLKRGSADNELSRYRFDAVLTFDAPTFNAEPQASRVHRIDATESTSVNDIIRGTTDTAGLVVRGLINPRVADDVCAWRKLAGAAGVGQGAAAIDPDAWRQAVRGSLPSHRVECRPSDLGPDRYDVAIYDAGETPPAYASNFDGPLTNRPLQQKLAARLAPRLRAALAERAPAYMVPSAFVIVDALPRTVQGKIDRNALPPPPAGRPAWASGYVQPATDHERLIAGVWEELLGFEPVGAEDDFFALGGHSMLAVRVMAEIERRSGVGLPLAALFHRPTVRHLGELLANPAAAVEGPALVPLQTGGAGSPLFCIHPAGGTVFCYQELAEQFAGERPIIGVQAQGVDGLAQPHESVDEIAESYAAAIRAHSPVGPYHLCGWSLGGNLAYAVAVKLREEGAEVGLVGLFDAGATPPEESLAEADLAPLLAALFPGMDHLPLEEIRQLSPQEQVAFFTERAAEAGLVDPAQLEASGHIFDVFQKNVQAVHQHATGAYPGRVMLFRAAEQEKTNALFDDPQLGWGAVAAEVDVVEIPSTHNAMMSSPQVEVLASELKPALLGRE